MEQQPDINLYFSPLDKLKVVTSSTKVVNID